jgi:hypothetical protein
MVIFIIIVLNYSFLKILGCNAMYCIPTIVIALQISPSSIICKASSNDFTVTLISSFSISKPCIPRTFSSSISKLHAYKEIVSVHPPGLIKNLDINLIEQKPSLVGLNTKESFKDLSGTAVKA